MWREALQDPAARLCPAAGTVQPLGFGEGSPNLSRQLRSAALAPPRGGAGCGRRFHSPAEAGKGGGPAGVSNPSLLAAPPRETALFARVPS